MPVDAGEGASDILSTMQPAIDIAVADPRWTAIVGDDADTRLAPLFAALFSQATVPDMPATASLILADDTLVHALNRDYRGRDKATNVLSFPFTEDAPDGTKRAPPVISDPPLPTCLGDVYVAFETTTAEADGEGKPRFDHLCHLIIHGMLHLLGFDHQDAPKADMMENLERNVLDRLGIADPYATPTDEAAPVNDDQPRPSSSIPAK